MILRTYRSLQDVGCEMRENWIASKMTANAVIIIIYINRTKYTCGYVLHGYRTTPFVCAAFHHTCKHSSCAGLLVTVHISRFEWKRFTTVAHRGSTISTSRISDHHYWLYEWLYLHNSCSRHNNSHRAGHDINIIVIVLRTRRTKMFVLFSRLLHERYGFFKRKFLFFRRDSVCRFSG